MRADRLISILMLLQTHNRMTAGELSKELEVTPRTIYRDIIALSTAGVPVYMERGPGGGIALLDSYRTNLTGMDEDEIRALLMLSVPEALVELGVGQKLKAALLKLAVALPVRQRMLFTATQQRIYLDSSAWTIADEPGIQLGKIHQAVWQDKLLRIVFQGSFDTRIEIEIEPYGLVSKMNAWYLMGKDAGHIKVVRVREIVEAEILEQDFRRDESFSLAEEWKRWCKNYQSLRPIYPVRVKVAPTLINKLTIYLGETVKYSPSEAQNRNSGDWSEVTIFYENYFRARESILSLGRSIEVLEPEALRLGVIDLAEQIIHLYQTKREPA